MEYLEKFKQKNLPNYNVDKGPAWNEAKDQKNQLLFKLGRGEDLLLSHLACRLGNKRAGDKVIVSDAPQYQSLFGETDQIFKPKEVAAKDYDGRLENIDDFFSQKCPSTRTAATSELSTTNKSCSDDLSQKKFNEILNDEIDLCSALEQT